TRIQVLIKALNGAAFTSSVAAFKQDDVALTSFLGPVLPFQQLDLQRAFGDLVLLAGPALVIRIVLAPSLTRGTIGHTQARIIFVRGIDYITVGLCQIDNW